MTIGLIGYAMRRNVSGKTKTEYVKKGYF